jgi:aconitate hydratase
VGEDLAGARLAVVMDYLERAGLTEPLLDARLQPRRLRLHDLHRQLRPAAGGVSEAVNEHDLAVAAVLSGNRNFEGRIHPDVKMNYLASPPLVVAYALAGTMDIDLTSDPLGTGKTAAGVPARHLAERRRGAEAVGASVTRTCSASATPTSSTATSAGRRCEVPAGDTYAWDPTRPTCAAAVLRRA